MGANTSNIAPVPHVSTPSIFHGTERALPRIAIISAVQLNGINFKSNAFCRDPGSAVTPCLRRCRPISSLRHNQEGPALRCAGHDNRLPQAICNVEFMPVTIRGKQPKTGSRLSLAVNPTELSALQLATLSRGNTRYGSSRHFLETSPVHL